MRELSGAELAVLVNELSGLEGLYIEKFYELGEDRFRIKLSKRGSQINLQIILARTINTTSYVEIREDASNFAMAARKRVEGFVIESIGQVGDDRIIEMRVRKGETKLNLIIEMFGKGNLIVTDESMNILLAYKVHDFKDRSIRPGVAYVPPKKNVKTPLGAQPDRTVEPVIYRDANGVAVDFSISRTEKYSGLAPQRFTRLGEALDTFYHERHAEEAGKAVANPMAEELEASIYKQEKLITELEAEMEQNKGLGEAILNNAGNINQVIETARSRKRVTVEELQTAHPGIKVLEVDLKEKTLLIEL